MTITQTVEIPENRRLHLNIELPKEMPAGEAHLEVKVIPFVKKSENKEKLRISKKEWDELPQEVHTPHTNALTGILAHLGDITIEQIREERLAKYLQ